MKDLLEFIVKSIVDHPDQVKIKEEKEEGTIILKLNLAPEDMGRVIGKKGKIIKAIRTLVRIPAIKQGIRVNLDLEEVPGVTRDPEIKKPEADLQSEPKDQKD